MLATAARARPRGSLAGQCASKISHGHARRLPVAFPPGYRAVRVSRCERAARTARLVGSSSTPQGPGPTPRRATWAGAARRAPARPRRPPVAAGGERPGRLRGRRASGSVAAMGRAQDGAGAQRGCGPGRQQRDRESHEQQERHEQTRGSRRAVAGSARTTATSATHRERVRRDAEVEVEGAVDVDRDRRRAAPARGRGRGGLRRLGAPRRPEEQSARAATSPRRRRCRLPPGARGGRSRRAGRGSRRPRS